MIDYNLTLLNVTKIFGRRLIFKELNYSFSSSNIYGIVGKNGSGKSTLSKIISGLITPTKGKAIHKVDDKTISAEKLHNHLGFVSPYLSLYDEFSAEENINHIAKIRGLAYDQERFNFLMNEFNLFSRKGDLLKGYSSGMKQRIKFIFALYHKPQLMVFDEPTSNLDNEGKNSVYKIIEQQGKDNCIIIASNEKSDIELCQSILSVEDFRK